jgi:hypothetical protein
LIVFSFQFDLTSGTHPKAQAAQEPDGTAKLGLGFGAVVAVADSHGWPFFGAAVSVILRKNSSIRVYEMFWIPYASISELG